MSAEETPLSPDYGTALTTGERWQLYASMSLDSDPDDIVKRVAEDRDPRTYATVERIIADRMATAWHQGVLAALSYSVRNEDGITLSLDTRKHPNPYLRDALSSPSEPS